ncbi:hypothetical protein D9758_008875 [Tetrapyrgos nigripes]|uniref:G domain-containing protein n=1 Tax=Tetrapyrgos nigripes TaxID=182062 RepID=A0A8H5FPJ5_9AGAR|nr:hypothetical protein D9758_008875 [Tetrapyrgos nigripes]
MSSQEEIVIVVMGSTGTGKSSFINLLTGDNTVKIGNTLNSETSEIQLIRFIDPASRRKVVIVDTPGFDDSRSGVTNTNVLTTITEFLLEEYDKDRKINGLVYLHRISDTRFGGQASHNLKLFKSLCGRDNFKNVVALTTFWDRVDDETGRRREAELKAKFMKDLVEGGAHFMRHDRSMEGDRKVLKHILTLASTNHSYSRRDPCRG